MQCVQVQGFKVTACLFQSFCTGIQKVKATNDINNPALPANVSCILCYVANTGMRAAGNNDKTCTGPERESRIIEQMVWFHPAIW